MRQLHLVAFNPHSASHMQSSCDFDTAIFDVAADSMPQDAVLDSGVSGSLRHLIAAREGVRFKSAARAGGRSRSPANVGFARESFIPVEMLTCASRRFGHGFREAWFGTERGSR